MWSTHIRLRQMFQKTTVLQCLPLLCVMGSDNFFFLLSHFKLSFKSAIDYVLDLINSNKAEIVQ